MSNLEYIESEFRRIYGAPAERFVRAPGRVNLIGEHTDYNEGWVMPIAIDLETSTAARRRLDNQVFITALDLPSGQTDVFRLDDIGHHTDYRWANYVRGVAYFLADRGVTLPGIEAVISSTVHSGAGLSSSAALQVGVAKMFLAFAPNTLDDVTVAQLCQQAENVFVGVQSGIMDHYASALGKAGAALKIDCRTLTYETIKLPRGVVIVVADTNKKRHLAGSDYNTRRMECENAVTWIGQILGKRVESLRDVSARDLRAAGKYLPENLLKRARHVITENERVKQAARAAQRNDAAKFGVLMDESQKSLRDDYEASSPELEIMIAAARRQPGCLGSRLTGAGWGGATVNLVREGDVPRFVENVAREYKEQTNIEPWIAPVQASAGASVIESPLIETRT